MNYTPGAVSNGYDRSRRCYQIQNNSEKPYKIQFTLHGNKNSPVFNPAVYIKNWNAEDARVLLNGKEFKEYEVGINYKLGGIDLFVFFWIQMDEKIDIDIITINSE